MKFTLKGLTLSTNFTEINLADWISQAEAARLRGCTRQAISKLIRKKKLNVLEIGGHVLVNKQEVLEYTDGNAGRPKLKNVNSGNQETD